VQWNTVSALQVSSLVSR